MLPRTKRSSLTLMELLVVIAIVGILAGMVLPALSRARESARRAVCAGRLKRVGLSLIMYSNNNQERVPYLNPPPYNVGAGTFLRMPCSWDGPTLVDRLAIYGTPVQLLTCPSASRFNPPGQTRYGDDYILNYLYLCRLDEIKTLIPSEGATATDGRYSHWGTARPCWW